MYFEDLASFIAMGGHGKYIWLAYSATLLIIIYNLMTPVVMRKKLIVKILTQQQRSVSKNKILQSE